VVKVEKFYYPNGKVQEHTVRHADDKSFTTKNYWPNGKLQAEASFEIKTKPNCTVNEAVRVGKAYKYAADGKLREQAHYDDIGRLDGAHILIDDQGRRTESVYAHDTLTARKIFSADGKLEAAEKYDNNGSKK
jgi:antitoxin component YwqK of YwqJK toxin-antitoxin module